MIGLAIALDHESSSCVLAVLSQIKKNKMVIVISYRKVIMEISDRVF